VNLEQLGMDEPLSPVQEDDEEGTTEANESEGASVTFSAGAEVS